MTQETAPNATPWTVTLEGDGYETLTVENPTPWERQKLTMLLALVETASTGLGHDSPVIEDPEEEPEITVHGYETVEGHLKAWLDTYLSDL